MRNRLFVGFAMLWFLLMTYKIFNPAASDGKDFFQGLPAQKIRYVELTPAYGSPPIGRSMVISDHDKVIRFTKIWVGIDTLLANHPKDIWSINVVFHADRGIYSGVIRATSNQGVIFDFDKGPSAWPVSSEYQFRLPLNEIECILRSLSQSPRDPSVAVRG
jgi:hypothetical protein